MIGKLSNAPTAVVAVTRNFGWMLASRGLNAVFSLIYLAIVTRSLGVEGFGKFALITGAAQLLSSLLTFQTWQMIVQYGVQHAEDGDDMRLARLFRCAILLDVISAITGMVAAAVILHFFADMLGLKPTLARATLIFNIIILLSLRSTPLGIMRLRNRFSFAAAADSVTPILRLTGAVVAAIVHPTLQGFLIAWAISELLTGAAHWYAVYRIGDFRLIREKGQDLREVFADNPGITRFSLTTNFSDTLVVAGRQLPLFLVGGLAGTAAAGAFRLAAQLSRSLTQVSQMIARAAFPEIVRAVRNQGVSSLSLMIVRSLRVAGIVSIVAFLSAVVFGELVLEVVGGEEFGRAYHVLLWLAAGACIDLLIVAFEPSIMAAHRAHLAFLARLAGTLVMIGVAMMLENSMGANGIAAAVFGNSVVQALLLGVILLRLVRRPDEAPPGDGDAQPRS